MSVMRRCPYTRNLLAYLPDYHCNCGISLDDLLALASAVTWRLLCHQLLRFMLNRHVRDRVTGEFILLIEHRRVISRVAACHSKQ